MYHQQKEDFLSLWLILTITSFSAPDMSSSRRRRALPTRIRCPLALVADFRFFREMGQSSKRKTINYMVSMI